MVQELGPCRVCGAEDWSRPAVILSLPLYHGGGSAALFAPVVCQGCEYTLLFSVTSELLSEVERELSSKPKIYVPGG